MSARKQFHSSLTPSVKLTRLLKEARGLEVSEEELREQRISFAFGNAPPSDLITKDTVRRTAANIRLR